MISGPAASYEAIAPVQSRNEKTANRWRFVKRLNQPSKTIRDWTRAARMSVASSPAPHSPHVSSPAGSSPGIRARADTEGLLRRFDEAIAEAQATASAESTRFAASPAAGSAAAAPGAAPGGGGAPVTPEVLHDKFESAIAHARAELPGDHGVEATRAVAPEEPPALYECTCVGTQLLLARRALVAQSHVLPLPLHVTQASMTAAFRERSRKWLGMRSPAL